MKTWPKGTRTVEWVKVKQDVYVLNEPAVREYLRNHPGELELLQQICSAFKKEIAEQGYDYSIAIRLWKSYTESDEHLDVILVGNAPLDTLNEFSDIAYEFLKDKDVSFHITRALWV